MEGDSALGSCKLGRDSEFQAIMPVRGKILNCLKADYNRIFKSDIIVDVMKVLGCGVEVESRSNKELNTFDLSGLRWNKIVICTDADVDGFQIRTLILEGQKYSLQRSKGLGENEPDMMWLTTMNPETRRLIKVMPDDVEETARMFDLLLGDNLTGRKEYIAEFGSQYLEMADIS